MRYGESYKLRSHKDWYSFINDGCIVMRDSDWDQLEEGDCIFWSTESISKTGLYHIDEVVERTFMNHMTKKEVMRLQLRCSAFTPTGMISKSKNNKINLEKHDWGELYLCSRKLIPLWFKILEESREKHYGDRDYQKTKVYRSEWKFKEEQKGKKFSNIEEVKDFVRDIIRRPEIINNFDIPSRLRVIENTRQRKCAWANTSKIEMPCSEKGKWAYNELTVLHELTHSLVDTPIHGSEYTTGMLKLLKLTNKEIYSILKNNYNKLGVDYEEI